MALEAGCWAAVTPWGGPKGLGNVRGRSSGLRVQLTSDVLPDKKEVSLAEASGWSSREFSFHYAYYYKREN